MLRIKNWDNKTWISSTKYIQSFINFLLKQKKLTKHSKILDIGCGRGKITGSLSSKLKLINKPIGLDIENHKDFDKRITFKKANAIKYLKNNKKKFDLILIKQTIHFFNLKDIKKILTYSFTKDIDKKAIIRKDKKIIPKDLKFDFRFNICFMEIISTAKIQN